MQAPFPALRTAWLSLPTLLLCGPALAQQPVPSPAEDVHEQMRKLIVQIEQGLKRVDGLLWSADARDEGGEEKGIAATLAAARERSRKVLDDIDRLLEIRHHPHGDGSGGS